MSILDGGTYQEKVDSMFASGDQEPTPTASEPVVESASAEPVVEQTQQANPNDGVNHLPEFAENAQPETPAAEPAEQKEEIAPEVVEERHFQSEYQKLQRKTENFDSYSQLFDVVTGNPALREMTQRVMAGLDPVDKVAAPVAEPAPQPVDPNMPVRPTDYDEYDAINTPQSASYRYNSAVREQTMRAEIKSQVDAGIAEAKQAAQAEINQMKASQKQQLAVNQMNTALEGAGLGDRKQDFMRFAGNINRSTPAQLIAMFRAIDAIGQEPTTQVTQTQSELSRQREAAESSAINTAGVNGVSVDATPKDEWFTGWGSNLDNLR